MSRKYFEYTHERVARILAADADVRLISQGVEFYNFNDFTFLPFSERIETWMKDNPGAFPGPSTVSSIAFLSEQEIQRQVKTHGNNTIVIARTPPDSDLTQEMINALEGGIKHEIAHSLFSQRGRLDQAELNSFIRMHWKKEVDYSKQGFQKWVGIYEDEMVERLECLRHRGARRQLKELALFILAIEKSSPATGDGQAMAQVSCCIRDLLLNVNYEPDPIDLSEYYTPTVLQFVKDNFEDILADAVKSESSYGTLALVMQTCNRLHDLFQKRKEDQQDQQEDSSTGDQDEEQDCAGEDDPNQDSKGKGKGGKGKGQKGDSENKDDEELDADSLNDLLDDLMKDTESDPSKDEGEEKGEGQGEKGEEPGSEGTEQGNSGQSSPSPDAGPQSGENSSGDSPRVSEGDLQSKVAELLKDLIEEGTDESGTPVELNVRGRDVLKALTDLVEESQKGSQGQASSQTSMYPLTTEFDEVHYVTETDASAYEASRQEVLKQISYYRQRFVNTLLGMRKSRTVRKQVRGRFDPRNAHRVVTEENPRSFRQKILSPKKSTCVAVSLDESGSMDANIARQIAISLSEPLSQVNIPSFLFGWGTPQDGNNPRDNVDSIVPGMDLQEVNKRFHRMVGVRYRIYKDWGESYQAVKNRLGCTRTDSYTPLCEGVEAAVKAVMNRPEDRKVVFVITDGTPYYGYGNPDPDPEQNARYFSIIRRMCDEAKSMGIHVIGVGAGGNCSYLSTIFPDYILEESMDQLPMALCQKLNELLVDYKLRATV